MLLTLKLIQGRMSTRVKTTQQSWHQGGEALVLTRGKNQHFDYQSFKLQLFFLLKWHKLIAHLQDGSKCQRNRDKGQIISVSGWKKSFWLHSGKGYVLIRCFTGEENQNLVVKFSEKQGIKNLNITQKGIKLVFSLFSCFTQTATQQRSIRTQNSVWN